MVKGRSRRVGRYVRLGGDARHERRHRVRRRRPDAVRRQRGGGRPRRRHLTREGELQPLSLRLAQGHDARDARPVGERRRDLVRPGRQPDRLKQRRPPDVAVVDADGDARGIAGDRQLGELGLEQGDLRLHLLAPAERDLVGPVAQIRRQRLDRLERPAERDLRLADVVEHGEVRALRVRLVELLQRRLVEPLRREVESRARSARRPPRGLRLRRRAQARPTR